MVAQPEKRLLWHPRRENKFVVGGGTQLTLYEWVPESLQIKQVTSQLDLTYMKCFAWSPDPKFDDLVAVGLSNGRVDLMRLEATKYARDHVLSSGPSVSLPARFSRSCFSLAFSPIDPNYLAVGLDKVRNDSSLVIWDIHTAIPALSLDTTVPSTTTLNAPLLSVRSQAHIPRIDVGPRADPRILQQHAPADAVFSVAFLPQSPSLLLAAISHRWLRLFDLRDPSAPITAASKVHGIATDPLEPHRIGCFGDGNVTVWDIRRLTQPLLTFTEKDASADGARVRPSSAFATMEFSSTRRGVLATLERDAHHVRFWDLQQAEIVELQTPPSGRSRASSQSSKVTRSWTNPSSMLPWTGSGVSSSHPAHVNAGREHEAEPYHLVLADTRRTKGFSKPLSSFALVPTAEMHPLTSDILVVNKDGDLELYAVHDTPKHTPWSARGDLAIGIGCSYRILPGFHELGPPPEPWDILMQPSAPESKVHSLDRHPREESVRGRGGRGTPAPTFGRGDEDGFPALPGKVPTNLTATRPGRSRTYSPAALKNLHFEHSVVTKADILHPPPLLTVLRGEHTLPLNGGTHKHKLISSRHTKDVSPAKSSAMELSIQHVVEEDISMIMRRRATQGYGLVNPLHNSIVVRETSPEEPILAEVWLWIHHVHQLLCEPSPRLQGYNFAYQGLSGIWEGLNSLQYQPSAHHTPRVPQRSMLFDTPTLAMSALAPETTVSRTNSRRATRRRSQPPVASAPDEFLAAISTLNQRCGMDESSWSPTAATTKLSQRQFALQLCGWSLAQDDLALAIRKWEKENKHSQAACWLVFTDQHKGAVDVLMRSKDETLHMMSGMLAAFTPSSSSSRNPELIAHCERLIVRLQDPYLRAMLTYLTVRDWTEVLQEEALPLRERLAIAFQFLDDRELSSYLRRVTDRCVHDGDIEGIIVTGLTAPGMDILQAYVDIRGDVQTAAVLASLSPARAHDARAGRWLETYRDLLDGWKLFHHRCQFDIDRGRILQDAVEHKDLAPFEWAPRQILIRCYYCNKSMEPPFSEASNPKATACPKCGRPLPRCSICLMTLSIVQDPARDAALARSEARDTIDDALVFCQTCRHGGHASHILQWFYGEDNSRAHGTCPVAGCDCRCADEM